MADQDNPGGDNNQSRQTLNARSIRTANMAVGTMRVQRIDPGTGDQKTADSELLRALIDEIKDLRKELPRSVGDAVGENMKFTLSDAVGPSMTNRLRDVIQKTGASASEDTGDMMKVMEDGFKNLQHTMLEIAKTQIRRAEAGGDGKDHGHSSVDERALFDLEEFNKKNEKFTQEQLRMHKKMQEKMQDIADRLGPIERLGNALDFGKEFDNTMRDVRNNIRTASYDIRQYGVKLGLVVTSLKIIGHALVDVAKEFKTFVQDSRDNRNTTRDLLISMVPGVVTGRENLGTTRASLDRANTLAGGESFGLAITGTTMGELSQTLKEIKDGFRSRTGYDIFGKMSNEDVGAVLLNILETQRQNYQLTGLNDDRLLKLVAEETQYMSKLVSISGKSQQEIMKMNASLNRESVMQQAAGLLRTPQQAAAYSKTIGTLRSRGMGSVGTIVAQIIQSGGLDQPSFGMTPDMIRSLQVAGLMDPVVEMLNNIRNGVDTGQIDASVERVRQNPNLLGGNSSMFNRSTITDENVRRALGEISLSRNTSDVRSAASQQAQGPEQTVSIYTQIERMLKDNLTILGSIAANITSVGAASIFAAASLVRLGFTARAASVAGALGRAAPAAGVAAAGAAGGAGLLARLGGLGIRALPVIGGAAGGMLGGYLEGNNQSALSAYLWGAGLGALGGIWGGPLGMLAGATAGVAGTYAGRALAGAPTMPTLPNTAAMMGQSVAPPVDPNSGDAVMSLLQQNATHLGKMVLLLQRNNELQEVIASALGGRGAGGINYRSRVGTDANTPTIGQGPNFTGDVTAGTVQQTYPSAGGSTVNGVPAQDHPMAARGR